MSGALAALATAGALFLGPSSTVTLGPIVLQSQEVPDQIPVGGKQQMVVHKLIGGGRVVETLGRDDMDLSWSGVMFDQAVNRAQFLDTLRVSGQAITLAFGPFTFTVVVSDFTFDFKRANWIPYSITCQVVQDNSAQITTPAPILSDQVLGDINSAAALILPSGALLALAAAESAAQASGAVALGTAAYGTLAGALGGASTALASAQAGANAAIAGIVAGAAGTAGIVPLAAGAAAAVSTLTSAAAQTQILAASTVAAGYVGRTITNLANASA